MKKVYILIMLLLTMSVFLMAQQCTIEVPENIGITLDTGQITEQETSPEQTTEQQTTAQTSGTPQTGSSQISHTAELIFLIIAIVSFIIALIAAIFGFRKEQDNTAGKILFTIFIVLFLVFLILYVLSLINII